VTSYDTAVSSGTVARCYQLDCKLHP